jgi:hypothetical protein
MSTVRIRDRTGLAEVHAGARVEPEIPLFCRCWVSFSFDAVAVRPFAWFVRDCRGAAKPWAVLREI